MRYLVVAALLFSLGCSHRNFCPDGTVSNGSRCVSDDRVEPDPDGSTEFEDADEPDLEDADGPEMDAETLDDVESSVPDPLGGADAGGDDAGADGETDATSPSATPDAAAGPHSSADANVADGSPLVPDVGPVGGAGQCSDEAVDAWRRFQMSANAVPSILACYAADPDCKDGSCNIDACLKGAAGMVGCDTCVAAENQCVAQNCATACGVSTDDDACRACACASRCFEAPAGCGVRNVDACSDCRGPSCSGRLAARSETVTVPILFHFVYDRTDPATGLPAYAIDSLTNETMLDIDAQVQRANEVLEAARSDARRLRLVRAGVVYVAASAAGSCPDPVAIVGPNRLFGGINVVMTRSSASCPSAAINAYAARASGGTLLHEVAHTLGLQDAIDAPGNVMSSHDQATLTPEQFLRMHNYVQWRLSAVGRVPESERQLLSDIMHGPDEPLWEHAVDRDYGLANAQITSSTVAGPFDLPAAFTYGARNFDARGAVLGLRFSAALEGTPSDDLRLIINQGLNHPVEFSRSSIRIRDGVMYLDEVFLPAPGPPPLAKFRGVRGATRWTIQVIGSGTVPLRIRDARLELVQSDRMPLNNDRHARGCSDILVYRPAASVLFTALSPCNGSLDFGRPVLERLPPLPDVAAKLTSGDVDGDGGVDLIARRGASLWIALHADGYATWRPGFIAGSDLPIANDDVLMGDLDGDGYGDLLRRRPDYSGSQYYSRYAFYRGVGDGSFEALRRPNFGAGEDHPLRDANGRAELRWALGDVMGHGLYDLIVRERGDGWLWTTENLSAPPSTTGIIPTFWGAWRPGVDGRDGFGVDTDRLLVMDVNQDGVADLVTRQENTGEWRAYIRNAVTREFARPLPITFGGQATAFLDTDVVLGAVQ